MSQLLFKNKFFLCAVVICLSFGCRQKTKDSEATQSSSGKSSSVLFSKVPAGSSNIGFVNTLIETDKMNIFTYEYLYNGAGVAIGDINNDGLPDIFFTANTTSCRLYKNNGNFSFTDITAKAGVQTTGWSQGVTMADVNNDGLLDIYVCRSAAFELPVNRKNLLFINNGNETFSEKAQSFGLDNDGYSTHASFFDYDRDGDLDMYLVNHGIKFEFDLEGFKKDNSKIDKYVTHRMYRNNGNSTFTDVTREAGMLCNTFGLSATVGDLNSDGWDDIYVSNDYTMPDFLYINNRNGTFTDRCQKMLRHIPNFSMGSDIADFNNDGLPDIISLDMLPESNYRQKSLFGPHNFDKHTMMVQNGYGNQFMQNCLQLNNGNGSFSEIAELSGVAKTDWSWAALFADFDNDGWKDLYITNGYLRDFTDLDFIMYRAEEKRKRGGVENTSLEMLNKMPSSNLRNYMFRNNGNVTFTDVSETWGFPEMAVSSGAAYGDLDNDGDLDLVISNINDTAFLYRNNSEVVNKHHSIRVKLKGNESNPYGVGSHVEIKSDGITQMQQLTPARGYMSSVDYTVVFGLKDKSVIDTLKVKWYDGKQQTLLQVKADTTIILSIKDASAALPDKQINGNKIFAEAAPKYKVNFIHYENYYIDFKREPLLTHQASQNGPGIAVGDADGDGLDDFYVGGAEGRVGELFFQQHDGTFKSSTNRSFENDKKHEDMGALFFDSDNDNDLDLYVVSGGTTANIHSALYQDRLYINNGKGKFDRNTGALPPINNSGSCVIAGDYDGDGDADLFVGGRIVPGLYPYAAQSYLLKNDKGKFTDVSYLLPDSGIIGMVTSALWTDFNNDNKPDLVVTGEWMPVLFFENTGEGFISLYEGSGLESSTGWWNSITGADFDNDGDIDYVAGNYGWNSKIKTSPSKPALVVFKDFDGNHTTDAVVGYYQSDGKCYPWCSRDDLTDQVRPMKKRFLRYADYAGKTIEQIFTHEESKDAKVLYAFTFATSYIENLGGRHFKISALPIQAQCSPVFGIAAKDFDQDGNTDVLLTGNLHSENVNIGRSDAGNGLLMKGNGKGQFNPVQLDESGFYTPGDAKSLALVYNNFSRSFLVLVANNANRLQVFEWKYKEYPNSRAIKAGNEDVKISWEENNGKKKSEEVYFGSGYLSQSSRVFIIPPGAANINITGRNGKTKPVKALP